MRIAAASCEHIPLSTPYTNERLQAAIERVARILGQDLTTQNPILNTRLPDGSRVAVVGAAIVHQWPDAYHPQIQSLVHVDELIDCGQLAGVSSGYRCGPHRQTRRTASSAAEPGREDDADESVS